jgi:hypothetical protein
MQSPQQKIKELEQKLRQLERHNQFWKNVLLNLKTKQSSWIK